MAKRLLLLSAVAAAALAVTSFGGSVTGAASTDQETATAATGSAASVATEELGEPHGITAEELNAMAAAAPTDVTAFAWPVPNQRGFFLEASCQGDAGAIRQGAGAWEGMTEGSDTPVECRNDYIADCGGGGNIVGCNWGQGQRIALFMGGVNDDALLAAHEFGHDWYGHSGFQCAGWGSPEEVMSPTICNLGTVTSIDE